MRRQLEFELGTPPALPEGEVWPPESLPSQMLRAQAFKKPDIRAKVALLQSWSRDLVLPVLGAYQRRADPKFGGVVAMGELLEKTDFSKPMNVDKLLNKNNDYWRGMLEMNRGNPLVTATRIFMEVANGNFDKAKRCIRLHKPFLEEDASTSGFIFQFIELHADLRDELDPKVMAAVNDFAAGDFDGAIAKCESILEQHPRDAWARYELWLSKKMRLSISEVFEGEFSWEDWPTVAKEIYAMDSIYPIAVRATNDREAFELSARLELTQMNRPANREEYHKYWVRRADLALDLEVFPFAAEAYWLILGSFPKKSYDERPLMDVALYAIDQAGGDDIIGLLGREREAVAKTPQAQVQQRLRDGPKLQKTEGKSEAEEQ